MEENSLKNLSCIPSTIYQEIDKYELSRPIFNIVLDDDCSTIGLKTIEMYKSNHKNNDIGPIAKIINSFINERFNPYEYRYEIDRYDIAERSIESLLSIVREFILKNQKLKNPRQGSLYRFFIKEANTNKLSFNEDILAFYERISSIVDDQMKIKEGVPRVEAVYAIETLKIIKTKHGNKNE